MDLMKRLIGEYKTERDALQRQLDLLEIEGLRTYCGAQETTSETIERVRRWRDELHQIITEYEG